MSIIVRTLGAEASRAVARALARQLRSGDLLVLDGPLGAGKTTFTQGLGQALGVRGAVASPTFVISRVHPSLTGGPALVHVDAYRLGSAVDIEDLDLDADLADAVTVIEWGRDRTEHLSDSHLLIELERAQGDAVASVAEAAAEDLAGDEPRTLTLTPSGPRWDHDAVIALGSALAAVQGAAVQGAVVEQAEVGSMTAGGSAENDTDQES